ncbi:MAG: hypothetical protein MK085_02360 [Phycisphaerales bacterium]|nr:hypothetical protein [Phycisphaerales bacterium]
MSVRTRTTPGLIIGLLISFIAGGCVTETTVTTVGQPSQARVRAIAPAPSTAPINDMAILKSIRPLDTDGNGFPNRLEVAVYLFSRPYPMPRFADGSMVFTMYAPGTYDFVDGATAEPVAAWEFEAEQMSTVRIKDVIGEGYALALDLNDLGISRLPVNSTLLVTEFHPESGERVRAGSVQSIPYTQ